jgi:D-sedoheptulose 7-phosphate isomerase
LSHASEFLGDVLEISRSLDANIIEKMALELASLRERNGRLFLLGVGGSAGNCSHAVNDFRKLCGIEAYTPTDNVSELTARANDEGLDTIFTGWLEISRLGANDAVLVFSVGGGDSERNVSTSIVKAVDLAKARGARVLGVVGRDSGHTARYGDLVIVVPTVEPKRLTPLTEAFQAVIWHCLVSHPALQVRATKW